MIALGIITVFLFTPSGEYSLTQKFEEGAKEVNYERAKTLCLEQEKMLPNANALSSYLKDHRSTSKVSSTYWLPIEKMYFTEWWWTSGDKYGPMLYPNQKKREGRECAVMRTGEGVVDEMICHQHTFGFVCYLEETRECPIGVECRTFMGYHLEFHKGQESWYEAMNTCSLHADGLAAFPGLTLDSIISNLSKIVQTKDHFFFGMVHSLWHKSNMSAFKLQPIYKWALNEPKYNKNCSVMDSMKTTWKSADCMENHKYVCVASMKEAENIKYTKKEESASSTNGTNGEPLDWLTQHKTSLGIFGGLLCGLALTALFVFGVHKRRDRNRQGVHLERHTPESRPLT